MATTSERDAAVRTLGERIKGLGVAMLTTSDPDGSLRSRPMIADPEGFDGDLWFLARAQSRIAWGVERSPRVNVAFADPRADRYVSVTGTAHVVRDPARAAKLWDFRYKSWLSGPDDPELRLIRVVVEEAQSWGGPGGVADRIEGF